MSKGKSGAHTPPVDTNMGGINNDGLQIFSWPPLMNRNQHTTG
jgi:hypothetical protein